MPDKEEQEDELTALTSIYDDRVFTATEKQTEGQFMVNILLPEDFQVQLEGVAVGVALKAGIKPVQQDDFNFLSISYLPPIMLHFQYPEDYPSVSSPIFNLSCKWLSVKQLSRLCSQLDDLWEESKGEVILFHWIQFLQDESFHFLELNNPLQLDYSYVCSFADSTAKEKSNIKSGSADDDGANAGGDTSDYSKKSYPDENASPCQQQTTYDNASTEEKKRDLNRCKNANEGGAQKVSLDKRAIQDVASVTNLIHSIIQHDLEEKQRAFNAGFYHCQICLEERMGSECMSFPHCRHVYCKGCMKEYFNVQITEGNVKALTCPEQKCESQASQSQVRALVSEEMFARYDRLLLKHSLDGMADITSCPRLVCQCPVIIDQDCNMGVCSSCHFPFCTLCNMAYHGVSPCRIRKGEILKLKEEYDNGDAEKREFLKKKYGRKMLRRLLEDSYSEMWVDKNSRKCPSCGSSIQKIDGCNKMMCTNCHTYFCWLCMKILSKANPYLHFQEMNSKCYNLLFQGLEGNRDADEDEQFGDDGQDVMFIDLQQLIQFL